MALPDPRLPGGRSTTRKHVARTDRAYVELKSRLPQISIELAKQAKFGGKDLADAIAEGAKERVPRKTGKLHDAIHVEFEGDDDWRVVAGDKEAFYGHMVEFGTARAVPHPFLVPAAEAQRMTVAERFRKRFLRL